jgi:hypothetical protein
MLFNVRYKKNKNFNNLKKQLVLHVVEELNVGKHIFDGIDN